MACMGGIWKGGKMIDQLKGESGGVINDERFCPEVNLSAPVRRR